MSSVPVMSSRTAGAATHNVITVTDRRPINNKFFHGEMTGSKKPTKTNNQKTAKKGNYYIE